MQPLLHRMAKRLARAARAVAAAAAAAAADEEDADVALTGTDDEADGDESEDDRPLLPRAGQPGGNAGQPGGKGGPQLAAPDKAAPTKLKLKLRVGGVSAPV